MGPSCHRYLATILAIFVAALGPFVAKADTVIFADGFEFGFQVLTPDIAVAPGDAATYCYYFHAPNAGTWGIRRWASTMRAGMHHMILYASYGPGWNPVDYQPPGTLTATPCTFNAGGGSFAGWLYAAHDATQALEMPADDGTGNPLGIEIAAGQPLFLQLYVINASDTPITTSALLKAEAIAPQSPFTKTATYLAYENNMSLGSGNVSVQDTCATPTGAKFWWLSTRTHHFANSSKVINAGGDVVVSTDWEHPAVASFAAPDFFQFGPGGLTYQCVYDNQTGHPIHDGDSESTDENCIGVGYFFPAAHPALCLGSVGPL